MKLKFNHESDFRRERDFGAKVGATFEFISAQFKPLFKCLVYFVLPAGLLFGMGMGLIFSGTFALIPTGRSSHRSAAEFNSLALNSAGGAALAMLGALAAFLLLSSTVYGFVRVRMDTPASEEVQPAQVWAYIRSRLFRMVRAWLLLTGLGVLVMVLFMGITFALIGTAGVSGLNSPSAVGGLFGTFFLLMFPFVWVIVCLMLYFPALWIEDIGVWAALRRSFTLVYGKWWSTFGLYLVTGMIQGMTNYVFAIPLYALMMLSVLKIGSFESGIWSIVAGAVYGLGFIFTATIPLIAMAFQYFNLVERKEGLGLRLMLDSLGQTPAPQVSNTTYRADEEGEY
jgi:hypothetical protein